jgi:hypothetical protein
MKKTLSVFALIAGLVAFGATSAFALPTIASIDGTAAAGEWDNLAFNGISPLPYYLQVSDVDETNNSIQRMDISQATLLQVLSDPSFGGDGDGNADLNDGIYLRIDVYGAGGPQLGIASGLPQIVVTGAPQIELQGDLTGDGFGDIFNIFLRHYNTDAAGAALPASDKVEVCVGSFASCIIGAGPWTDLTLAGGAHARGTVAEYFIPSGTFGTPPSPPGTAFPTSFVGQITYDNGASDTCQQNGVPLPCGSADDVVVGSVFVPEPSTFALMGLGILGLLGFRRFKS